LCLYVSFWQIKFVVVVVVVYQVTCVIAGHCLEWNNFNSMFAIIGGLGHGSVSRLRQTWDRLPSKWIKLFEVSEIWKVHLHCFGAVSWVTERASCLSKKYCCSSVRGSASQHGGSMLSQSQEHCYYHRQDVPLKLAGKAALSPCNHLSVPGRFWQHGGSMLSLVRNSVILQ